MHHSSLSEKDLFAQIMKGNEKAFEMVFKAYYPSLVAYASKYVKDFDVAENIVQGMFVSIWEKRNALNVENPRGYLIRAVKNRCLNEIKSTKSFTDINEVNIPDEIEDIPDEQLIEQVQSVISMLPKERQKIFRMSRFDGLKYREIAEKLNLSIKTVEAQMGKALQFIREQLPLKIKRQN